MSAKRTGKAKQQQSKLTSFSAQSFAVCVFALAIGYSYRHYIYAVKAQGQVQSILDTCDVVKQGKFREQLLQYDGVGHFSIEEGESLLGECAIRDTYQDARLLFRKSAQEAGFELQSIAIHGDKYYTDVAVLHGHPRRFLIHVSGIHGVEGYAGSTAQVSALNYFSQSAAKRRALYRQSTGPETAGLTSPPVAPTIVFVHAINPFGMANNRRVNEDNIDVNRNFLTDEQLKSVRARDPNFAGYVDIDFLLNPTYQVGTLFGSVWLNDLHGLLKVGYAVLAVGIGSIKRSLVAGNYYKPAGMGFGGFSRSQSVETLIRLGRELKLDQAEKVVLIDVHTGLGPSGVDTLVYFGTENEQREAHMRRVFPLELAGDKVSTENSASSDQIIGGIKESSKGAGEGSAMAGYDLTVGTTDDYCREWMAPHLNEDNRICVTQEFGTVGVIKVGKALMDENYAFHHGSEMEKSVYGKRLRDCFFVHNTEWARKVAHRGVKVIMEAFDVLAKKKK